MKRLLVSLGLAVFCAVLAPTSDAGLFSKRYEFRSDAILEIGEKVGEELRLDTVRFHLPAHVGGRLQRTGGLMSVDVSVSNVSAASLRVGIAVALFDEQGRLLGVASGGTSLAPIKLERQKTYKLMFDNVNGEGHRATMFQISVENKP